MLRSDEIEESPLRIGIFELHPGAIEIEIQRGLCKDGLDTGNQLHHAVMVCVGEVWTMRKMEGSASTMPAHL
jgi:hypothetical protein